MNQLVLETLAAPLNVWQQAIDAELVSAHLGVAPNDATFEGAQKAIHELICWHIGVATDPATNGGQRLTDAKPTTGEPVGYMNEGHIHELAMRRLPYGYVYPEAGAGASTAVYTHTAPSVPDDVALDAKRYRWLRDKWLDNEPESINTERAKGQCGLDAAVDAAIAAAKGE